ncbi:penicillin-binding protein [Oryzihumus sp.]|uniref:penicillin-binding protein n=1 Tax=Oryzihumus sp. TaxID=1968903 RepID=UPI002ED8FBCD
MQGRATNLASITSLLGALVATSVVMGLLGAGLVMPLAGATGAAARSGVQAFDSLPGEFKQTPLSQQSRVLASDGSLIVTPSDENRIIVPLSKVAPIMRQAQVAIEDSRFYEHGGVDLHGIARAFISNANGGSTQGASTLTQQYVKITLQENALRNNDKEAAQAATAKSYGRKLQELKYAVTLEKTLSKDQILEGYLNLVYYGDLAYGVEAAAHHYFGIPASKLNLPQAALLAGLVQLPSSTDPVHHPDRALARRNVVLDRMHDLNLITDKQWQDARASKLNLNITPGQSSCAASPYPYFCAYTLNWLLEQPALGRTVKERKNLLTTGGLTIQTTLDPKMEQAVNEEIRKKVPVGNSAQIGSAAAIVEPGSGKVLAIGQNTDFVGKKGFGTNEVNWSVDTRYGGSTYGFQFGSTAKMYAVATALKDGMPVNSQIYAKPADAKHAAFFAPSEYADRCRSGVPFVVRNDEGTRVGNISLTDAAAFSVNTAFAGLVAKLGVCNVQKTMTEMGLHQADGQPIQTYPSPVTLGSDGVSPLTLASSYATIASGGTYCPPVPVVSITTYDHKSIKLPANPCKRVIDADVANGTTEILKAVLTKGTAAGNELAGGRPAAGKTGTTDNSNETWFMGYTPQLATAVWVGTPTDNSRHLRNMQIGSKFYAGQIFGATIAAPIWKAIMDRASAGMPIVDFGGASDKMMFGDQIVVPYVGGLPVDQAIQKLNDAGFTGVQGGSADSSQPAGTALFTSPAAGSRAVRGSTVTITVSTGNAPSTPTPTKTKSPSPKPTKPTPSKSPSPTPTKKG